MKLVVVASATFSTGQVISIKMAFCSWEEIKLGIFIAFCTTKFQHTNSQNSQNVQEDSGMPVNDTLFASYGRIYCQTSTLGNLAVLRCQAYHSVDIAFANFGRTSTTLCPGSGGRMDVSNCDTYKGYYTVQMKTLCDGKRNCTYNFPQFNVEDPCPGFLKYLEVHYNCLDCELSRWGPECEQQCHCKSGQCGVTTGLCPPGGCQEGWHGTQCKDACNDGFFGPNCEEPCNCKGVNCDSRTGVCPELQCLAGWTGEQCNEPCAEGAFGENCAQYCTTSCILCDRFLGCTICVGGRTNLPDCQADCPQGTFGIGCGECGNCLAYEPCNIITGHCADGCEAGFEGWNCSTGCNDGWFGKGCDYLCGNCKGGAVCDSVSGKCPTGCEFGYVGFSCSHGLAISIVYMVIPFVWATGCLILCPVLVLCRENAASRGYYEIRTRITKNLDVQLKELEDGWFMHSEEKD